MFRSCNHTIGRTVTVGGATMYAAGGIDNAFIAKLLLSCLVTYVSFVLITSDDKSQR